MPLLRATRRVHFNAAHRLGNPDRSPEWIRQVFGPCANPNFHGHNYELDVTVEGQVSAETGYVMDMNILKSLVEEKLLSHLDHHNPPLHHGRLVHGKHHHAFCVARHFGEHLSRACQ